jgi:hypothetical protein
MGEDIEDVTEVFRSVRDHEYNDLRNDIGGLMARVRAMDDAVGELSELEDDIQNQDWAIIPQGDEERLKRENLLIEILKIVDDGYLSSAWALRETFQSIKTDHAPEPSQVKSLCEKYKNISRAVMGLRIYSHHGNSLPIRITDDAIGEYIGSGEGVRRKIGVSIDDVKEKKGDEYHRSPDDHYGHLDTDFIHLPLFLRSHSERAEELANEFVEEVLRENSDTVQDYQQIGEELKTLLDSGAHNNY